MNLGKGDSWINSWSEDQTRTQPLRFSPLPSLSTGTDTSIQKEKRSSAAGFLSTRHPEAPPPTNWRGLWDRRSCVQLTLSPFCPTLSSMAYPSQERGALQTKRTSISLSVSQNFPMNQYFDDYHLSASQQLDLAAKPHKLFR